ncbi:MAG: hypothetical protein J5772_01965, partial [Clostridia bacterium]|nr:hypothetical protein [Clostridia bacterium]
IDNEEKALEYKYKLEKGYHIITIKLNSDEIFNLGYMFCGCTSLKSIEGLERSFSASVLYRESGMLYLLLLDECGFMKSLHFRSPLLEAADARVKVYDQFGEKSFRISFEMKEEDN